MLTIADVGSRLDVGAGWLLAFLLVVLAVRLGIHWWANRHLCAFCDTPLRTQAERDWGLCTTDRDALRDTLDRGAW